MKDTLNGDLIILTHVLNTTAVTGFVPAAKALGLRVWLLTDDIVAHQQFFSNPKLDAYPDEILSCDVFNAQSIIELILQNNLHPSAIFTNSDHLQTACAQAADFFALLGKDWRVCYRAKNKTAMRQYLKQSGLETTWYQAVDEINQLETLNPPYPIVAKPQQGVASMDVKLCQNHQDLAQFCNQFWQQHPNQSLLLEQYLQGTAFTLETLGDGENLVALGGFDIELSPRPIL
ncbi:ATP-grasp domain-containing protein [Catenovulum sediminis]|uniref:ATP-grasp domain-containing protein n=1 Tax=Catenovulum sediminis TaxID=1740262 RepID=UPI00117D0363|nr:ATP-grasp domain-containing protein [Catenovulum sediminis]